MALTPEDLAQIKQTFAPDKPSTNWLSQHWLSLTMIAALSAFAMFSFQMTSDDVNKIWNKLFCVSLFWILATVFELFYNGIHYNINEKISADSRSLGTYLAAVLIGTALIVALS